MPQRGAGERAGDWVRYTVAHQSGGVEFLRAHFSAHAYERHSHEGYAISVTETGAKAGDAPLRRVRDLLHDTPLADQSHFHKRFKGAFGVTPGQFAAAARGGPLRPKISGGQGV